MELRREQEANPSSWTANSSTTWTRATAPRPWCSKAMPSIRTWRSTKNIRFPLRMRSISRREAGCRRAADVNTRFWRGRSPGGRAFLIGANGADLRGEALVVEPTGDATFLTIKTDGALFIEAGRTAAMESNRGPRNLSSSTGAEFISSTRKAATESGGLTIMRLNIGGK